MKPATKGGKFNVRVGNLKQNQGSRVSSSNVTSASIGLNEQARLGFRGWDDAEGPNLPEAASPSSGDADMALAERFSRHNRGKKMADAIAELTRSNGTTTTPIEENSDKSTQKAAKKRAKVIGSIQSGPFESESDDDETPLLKSKRNPRNDEVTRTLEIMFSGDRNYRRMQQSEEGRRRFARLDAWLDDSVPFAKVSHFMNMESAILGREALSMNVSQYASDNLDRYFLGFTEVPCS